MLADCVEDDVVRLAVLREVLLQVVDDLVRTEGTHKLDVLRVAHRRDMSAEVAGQLHRRRSARARCAVDEKPRPLMHVSAPETGQTLTHAVTDPCRLLERHAVGNVREQAGLAHADVLGVRAVPETEDAVAHDEIGDCGAHRLDHACELEAQDPALGSPEPEHETPDERARCAHVAVRPGDRGGMDAHENLAIVRYGPLDLFES